MRRLAAHSCLRTSPSVVVTMRWLKADPRLVDVPASVEDCIHVYRHVITEQQEQKLWEELQPVIEKAGQKAFVSGGGSSREEATVRNVSVDLHGFEDFKDVRDHQRQQIRRVPGLKWSETLLEIANTIGKDLIGEVPDTARILEHYLPGYEMHVEAPPFGAQYIALNLFAPGVLLFDNEAAGERGKALVPERGVLHCQGEARWGWRVGESFDPNMVYEKTRQDFDPEYRISIWLFKFNANLADVRGISDAYTDQAAAGGVQKEQEQQTIKEEDVIVMPSSADNADNKDDPEFRGQRQLEEADRREKMLREKAEEEEFAREALNGAGILGGDLKRDSEEAEKQKAQFKKHDNMSGEQRDGMVHEYKKDIHRLSKIMERVKENVDAGKGEDEQWMRSELNSAMSSSGTRGSDGKDKMGHDDANPEKSWDDIGERAAHYKRKLQGMDFDSSPTDEGMINNAEKMKRAHDDIVGEPVVEPFNPREAARILEENRKKLKATKK